MVPRVLKRFGQALVGLTLVVSQGIHAGPYSRHPEAMAFVDDMVSRHGMNREAVQGLIDAAERKQSILDAMSRPAEKTKTWAEYRNIFITEERIRQGVEFWRANRAILDQVEKAYGVDAYVIVGILGVETRFGRQAGTFRVIDALSTLAFDYPPRAAFFRGQLEQYLLMVQENQLDGRVLTGSYAGAMGWGQFIPSSYRSFAVDFDGDKIADIWKNPKDALASIANYFKAHGWLYHQPVTAALKTAPDFNSAVVEQTEKPELPLADIRKAGFEPLADVPGDARGMVVRLNGRWGDEYWLGLNNFYTITRYNHSNMYGMAVYQLGQEIRARVER